MNPKVTLYRPAPHELGVGVSIATPHGNVRVSVEADEELAGYLGTVARGLLSSAHHPVTHMVSGYEDVGEYEVGAFDETGFSLSGAVKGIGKGLSKAVHSKAFETIEALAPYIPVAGSVIYTGMQVTEQAVKASELMSRVAKGDQEARQRFATIDRLAGEGDHEAQQSLALMMGQLAQASVHKRLLPARLERARTESRTKPAHMSHSPSPRTLPR
jgi:hypothetical protein